MTPARKNRTAHAAGIDAENIAVWILRCKGYRILARRYKTPVGEIDIIAKRGKNIAFVEVKARAVLGDALQSISPQSQARITRAAEHYMTGAGRGFDGTMRFDVMVFAPPWRWRHVPDAWRAGF